MRSPTRTLYLGLDACDLHLTREFAADGGMPALAGLLESAATVETIAPLGFFVGADWPTIYSGTTPSRHQFLCSGLVRGGTYERAGNGPIEGVDTVWEACSRRGMRVASLDAPHAGVPEELNGVQLVEWGCHDRHARPRSYPARFVDEVNDTYGPHLGTGDHELQHFSPCDWLHRSGRHRTVAEDRRLLTDLLDSHRRKRSLTLDLLDRGEWDLFFSVIGESHCTGHQFWKYHDHEHEWHDPQARRLLGTDPLRAVYGAIDETVGMALERAGREATVFVHMSHGMRAHYDATCLLDPVLWRLDQYLSGDGDRGSLSRAADLALTWLPSSARGAVLGRATTLGRRYAERFPGGYFTEDLPWIAQRRWWMQPNDTVCGSVRLNLEGREPHGLIRARRARDAAAWLAERLLELVNLDTGERVVRQAYLTDDNYERVAGDAFGDLILEWNRDAPIETVWSPATGVVRVPYYGWRSGDHHRQGLLLARGPGIRPGPRFAQMPMVDVAPTVAASLDIDLEDVDGLRWPGLQPPERPPLVDCPVPRVSIRRRWSREVEVPLVKWVQGFAVGLAGAHHDTASTAGRADRRVAALEAQVHDLERLSSISQVTAWLRPLDVPESLLVSVVTPTRNRTDLLVRAINSVRAQSYGRWEHIVVDDASDDETRELLEAMATEDARMRPFRFHEHQRSSRARNHALDRAQGDVIVYLDDDNCFDPDWLKSVVWAFTEYPDTTVCYGARVIDDDSRHRGLFDRSLPIVQFLAWDGDEALRGNRVDQNVLAHRPSLVRFDESIDYLSDWDVILQLTKDREPLALPVLAAYYYTDAPRLSTDVGAEMQRHAYDYVRGRAIARQRGIS
ncbi:MAG TPA: glycosyltransferase [Acidimicrobiales bacterium]